MTENIKVDEKKKQVFQRYPSLEELKKRMASEGESYRSFSSKLGITTTCLSRKLNGQAELTRTDIYKMATLLRIKGEEYKHYFFPVELLAIKDMTRKKDQGRWKKKNAINRND